MFGYVRAQKSELLVREYEQYRGIYCTLCRQLGKSYGVAARLSLSYDCTFYAMLLLAIRPECTGFHEGRCVVNPLKKCVFCNGGEQDFTSASALSVLMTYHKVKDDIADSHSFGKIRGYLLLPVASHAKKKAARDFPEMARIVDSAMALQQPAEHSEAGVDACAEPTASMLSQVLALAGNSDAGQETAEARVLRQVGYFLGRWVYMMDAADDMEKDVKTHSFNPFVNQYGLGPDSTEEEFATAKGKANGALNMTLSQLIAAFNILDLKHFRPILENVIVKGLPAIQKERLFKEENVNGRSL